jgi:hypothetical protein
MKFESFISGTWKQQYQYKSFQPTPINQEWSWDDPRINMLMEKATKSLGELNAFTLIVPDVDRFIHMHHQEPVINVNQAAEWLDIKYYAANQLIGALVELDILQEITGWQRNRMFVFRKYRDVFSAEN